MHRIPLIPSHTSRFVLAALVVMTTFAARAEIYAPGQVAAAPAELPVVVKAVAPAALSTTPAPGAAAVDATVATVSPRCSAPTELGQLGQPLPRVARLLASRRPIKIVALGSSSTAGAGASSPEASYPSRLAIELAQRFPRAEITVLNRGVNGEEAGDMLARLETSVVAEKPDLVLWQVGTNAVLRDQPLPPASSLIQEGLARLKATGADVILIDPQFVPKVIAKAEAEGMVKLLATAAKQYGVNLFQRFALMRHWRERDGMAFETFVSPDQLHMNDWSYACVAKMLGGAIAEAATRRTTSASASASALPQPIRR
jgi:lysophospholipase L1-like esterase